jgi:hypothetical protein
MKSKNLTRWTIAGFLFCVAVIALIFLKKWVDQKTPTTGSSKIALETSGKDSFEKDGVKYLEGNWKELVLLNYKTGERGGDLQRFENQMVRIPGYIVPLTDEVAVLDEFLFVPNDQACIHVPPPPPNLIIKANHKHKLPFEDVFNPSWLYGKLEIVETKSQFGSASYQMNDATIEKYDENGD